MPTLLFVGYVGILSDRVGRKVLAIIGFIVLACLFFPSIYIPTRLLLPSICPRVFLLRSVPLLVFAPSQAVEFTDFGQGLLAAYVIRLIIGIGMVLVYPQFITMVVDYVAEKDRGKGMALNGMMMGLGSLLIFGIVAPIGKNAGVEVLFYISTAIAIIGVIFTTTGLKDRLSKKKAEKKGIMEVLKVVNKRISLKASYLCTLITRADMVIIATFLVSWAVKLADQYDLTSGEATLKGAIPMIVMGVFSMICMPVIGILIDKVGDAFPLFFSPCLWAVWVSSSWGVSPNPFNRTYLPGHSYGRFRYVWGDGGVQTPWRQMRHRRDW